MVRDPSIVSPSLPGVHSVRPEPVAPCTPSCRTHVRASAYDAQGVRRGAPRAERAPKKILRVVEG